LIEVFHRLQTRRVGSLTWAVIRASLKAVRYLELALVEHQPHPAVREVIHTDLDELRFERVVAAEVFGDTLRSRAGRSATATRLRKRVWILCRTRSYRLSAGSGKTNILIQKFIPSPTTR
jgi:hypothetical protein